MLKDSAAPHLPPQRHVKRKWGLDGSVAVAGADEAFAMQAAPGDLLYLKVGMAAKEQHSGTVLATPAACSTL